MPTALRERRFSCEIGGVVHVSKWSAKKAGKAKVYVKKGGVTYTYNVVVKKSSKLKAA